MNFRIVLFLLEICPFHSMGRSGLASFLAVLFFAAGLFLAHLYFYLDKIVLRVPNYEESDVLNQ